MTVVASAVGLALLVASTGVASASARQPSPRGRLLTYLWTNQSWLLRSYVTGVIVSGDIVVVSGQSRLTGATANVRQTLRNQPLFTRSHGASARQRASGVQTLRLRAVISAVQVWSVEGRLVARC